MVSHVRAARSQVANALATPLSDLDEVGLTTAITEAAALESQLQALKLQLAAEAERRQAAEDTGDTGTDAWLARLTGDRRELLNGGLLLAEALQAHHRPTLTALSEGRIRLDQARAIVNGLAPTVDEATPQQIAAAEDLLIAKATGEGTRSGVPMPPARLRQAARRAYARIDHDLHLRHQAMSVNGHERRGHGETWLSMGPRGDGTYSGRFSIPERHGELLRSVLEKLSAPRRLVRDRAGNSIVDDSAPDWGVTDRLGHALCELIEHLPTDRLGPSAITMLVKMDLDDLIAKLSEAGVATTGSGVDISAAEARRLACQAQLVPAVLGGRSEPLDLGRARRLHTDKQRQALALTHDSCAIAGCDRPFDWCEIHHPTPWSHGGGTDLDNALPLCGHHHRTVHQGKHELLRHSDTEWTLKYLRPPRRRPQPSGRYTYIPTRESGLPEAS